MQPPAGTQPRAFNALVDTLNSRVQDAGLRTIGLAIISSGLARYGHHGAARALLAKTSGTGPQPETTFPGLAVLMHARTAEALLRVGDVEQAHAHVARATEAAGAQLAVDDSPSSEDAMDACRSLIDLVLVAALAARRGVRLPDATLDALTCALGQGRPERTIDNLSRLVAAHHDALETAGLLQRLRPIASRMLRGRPRVRRIFLQDAIEVVAALAPDCINRRMAKRLVRRFEAREAGSGIDEHAIRPLSTLLRALGDPLVEAQGLAKRLTVGRRFGGWIAHLAALRAMAEAEDPRLDEALMEDFQQRAWRMPGKDVLRMRVVTRLLEFSLNVPSRPDTQHRWLSSALERARTMSPYARNEVECVVMRLAARTERGVSLIEHVFLEACERVHARPAGEGNAPFVGIDAVARGMQPLGTLSRTTSGRLITAGIAAARAVVSSAPDPDSPRHIMGVEALIASMRALNLSDAALVRSEVLERISWAQGVNLFGLVDETLAIAKNARLEEGEEWVAQVIEAVGTAMSRPVRRSRLLSDVGLTQERWLATSVTSAVADLLDPGATGTT